MDNNKEVARYKTWKMISAICETVLAVPVMGGLFVLAFAWMPLLAALVIHILTLVFTDSAKGKKAGSILGIITSVLGWIPGVGFMLHVTSCIVLWIEFGNAEKDMAKKDDDIKQ